MYQLVLVIIIVCLSLPHISAAQPSVSFREVVIVPKGIQSEHQQCVKEEFRSQLNKAIDNSDLQLVRQKINSNCFYLKGFINSGIVYPDQDFEHARLQIRLVEGQINTLKTSGNQALNDKWFRDYLNPALSKPFQIDRLRESLLLMERHPIIQKVDAKLLPGAILGEGSLDLKVSEQSPFQIDFELNNTLASPSVGQAFFQFTAKHYSLSGKGDRLSLDGSYSQGLKKIALHYHYPLSHKSAVNLEFLSGKSEIVEAPFDRLEISNQTERYRINFEYDLFRNLNQHWQFFTGLTLERGESQLLGKNFSFSPGVENGKSRLSIIDLGIRWNGQHFKDRQVEQVWSLENHLQIGVPILSATKNDEDPDSRFLKYLIQAQWRKRLSKDGKYQLLTRFNGQWSNSSLLPLEVYSVGGFNSVRGYRQSQFSRDIGWSASINLPISVKSQWEITPFVDIGQAWNQDYKQRAKLSSIGMALQWPINKTWYLYGHYAKRLSETRMQGSSLQDKGIGLQLHYRMR